MSERLDYNPLIPAGMKGLGHTHHYLTACSLPLKLIDLVYLRVSLINGCAYCIDMHSRDLLKQGMPVSTLVLVPVWREAASLFSPQEKAAMARAESVTNIAATGAPDDHYRAAAELFSEKELADLTLAIALMNAYNRMAIGFRKVPAAAKG
jgi:AhpD family alkylhydroperoxidase